MATPDFVLALREKIGHAPLWLSGVTAVVVRDDKVLLVRRADTGAWTPVTGIIDPGEEPAIAAEREVLEEANIVARTESLAWVKTLAMIRYPNGDESQYLDLVFRCSYISGEPFPTDGENTEAGWYRLDTLPDMADEMRARISVAVEGNAAARFER
ncbi:NUDIX domain-containing protein [Glaciihabitans sp. UYNi722]|uniref:NUDIX hydrolase n=1 Tax=Glaciihabitans sp. UYNi722 TaxID=3156344 RepID=UPI003392B201